MDATSQHKATQPPISSGPGPTRSESFKLGTRALKEEILRHIRFTLGNDPAKPDAYSCFMGLAYSVRDRLLDRWIDSQRAMYDTWAKRVYFLSMEFLPGRFLKNYLTSLQMESEARAALQELGFDLDELEEEEWDAGLGNGGLGRLASCYLDSMACRNIPAYGYGIRYDYGIFFQVIENGYQREKSDNWSRRGNPWEIKRRPYLYPVQFYGRCETYTDAQGRLRTRWVDCDAVMAMACDIMIPSCKGNYVTNLRLWASQSSREFNLEIFNRGDYVGAVEAKVLSENISKVLYPSDELEHGKELRLKQQYFFVAATLQDILRRFKKQKKPFDQFPDLVAIQLNDTHPAIAVAELMRLLLDEQGLDWEQAWAICEKSFGYTNHTVLPEALEVWPVDLIGRLLPRHLEIIYLINHHFLESVRQRYPNDPRLVERISLIQEGPVRRVRMAHLAIVGSHSVNGVAQLHTLILRDRLFKDFETVFPGRIRNVTNGITPRRWLYQANPKLSNLITEAIGPDWVYDLDQLKQLAPLADDASFRSAWMQVKLENKKRLARYVMRKLGTTIDPETLYDVQVKRIHEYKRQLLNALHVITLYNRIKADPGADMVPRTVLFAGKAAPAYLQAKRIIKLINAVGQIVNSDPDVNDKLRVIFLPNYCVSQAEKIIPAADLSEQISTAGMEASGTGNMKMALNGALTIGTLDGANIEIMEQVGRENMFIFGLTTDGVAALRGSEYNPRQVYRNNSELRRAIDMIASGAFDQGEPAIFAPLLHVLLDQGDFFLVLADFAAYVEAQERVSLVFQDPDQWARRSILNTAAMGRFSSDRAVLAYARDIWGVKPLKLE
jgi:starch phosphorylase